MLPNPVGVRPQTYREFAASLNDGPSQFIRVTDEIETAVRQAEAVADEKEVWIMAGLLVNTSAAAVERMCRVRTMPLSRPGQ
jgi:hypothetical protein